MWNTPRTFVNDRKKRNVQGDHICGTEDEFRNGEVLDVTRPEQKYNPSGIPLCCDPNRREADGLVSVGGSSHVVYSTPYHSSGKIATSGSTTAITAFSRYSSGFIGLSFTAIAVTSNPRTSTGLLAVKGGSTSVTDQEKHSTGLVAVKGESRYVPSVMCPEIAETCGDAELGWVDVQCLYTMPVVSDAAPTYLTGWRLWEVRPGTTYALDLALESGVFTDGDYELWRGFSCTDRELVFFGSLVGLSTFHTEIATGGYDRVFLKLIDIRSSVSLDLLSIELSTL